MDDDRKTEIMYFRTSRAMKKTLDDYAKIVNRSHIVRACVDHVLSKDKDSIRAIIFKGLTGHE